MSKHSSDPVSRGVRKTWNEMADWYDEKQGDEGDLWHRTLIDPCLLRVVGEVAGLRVLDLACGNGYLSRRFTREGARVTGVDSSPRLIGLAKAREKQNPLGIIYHTCDAGSLETLSNESFDLVVSNMALMDMNDAEQAIHEASRVLQPQGRFVASLSHPCFDTGMSSAWAIERVWSTSTVWRKVSRYRELHEGWFPWNIGPGQTVETIGYHRPLSWYFRVLRESGFAVTDFEEPAPTPEFIANSLQGEWIAQIPIHCVIGAQKIQL